MDDIHQINPQYLLANIVQLDAEFINFISKLDFKIWFRDRIHVDFINYFPNLKNGRCKFSTIFNIILTYLIMMTNNITKYKPIELVDILLDINNDLNKRIHNFIYSRISHIDNELVKELDEEHTLSERLRDIFNKFISNNIFPKTFYHGIELLDILGTIIGNNQLKSITNQYEDLLYSKLIDDPQISLLIDIIETNKQEIIYKLLIENLYPCIGNYDLYHFALIGYSKTFYMVLNIFGICTGDNTVSIEKIMFDYNTLSLKSNIRHNMESPILNLIRDIIIKRNWLEKEAVKDMFNDSADDVFQHIIKFR